jgi:hypothetical protein
MKIEVTQQDIDKGLSNNCFLCPIAHAVKRKMNTDCILVYCDRISVMSTIFSSYFYKLPKKAQTFIKQFDDGKPVKPFTFEIEKDLK